MPALRTRSTSTRLDEARCSFGNFKCQRIEIARNKLDRIGIRKIRLAAMRRISPSAKNLRLWQPLVLVFAALLFSCVENKPYRVGGIDQLDKYYSGQKPPSESV